MSSNGLPRSGVSLGGLTLGKLRSDWFGSGVRSEHVGYDSKTGGFIDPCGGILHSLKELWHGGGHHLFGVQKMGILGVMPSTSMIISGSVYIYIYTGMS